MARRHSKPLAGPDMLQPDEAARFGELRDVVRNGLATFVAVGNALLEIRDSRLYRQDYNTFAAFLRGEVDLSRSRGYELIEAASIARLLDLSATTDKRPSADAVRALAPIAKSAPATVQAVYTEATRRSVERGERTATAPIVREVVRERAPVPKPTPAGRPDDRAPETARAAVPSDPAETTVETAERPRAASSASPPASAGWQRFLDFATYCDDKLPAALGALAVRENGRDRLHRLRDFIDAADDAARAL